MAETNRTPKSDRRVVFPRVPVELESLGTFDLFYRNRDLRDIEDRFGSLQAFQESVNTKPFGTLPFALWVGLRHDPDAPSVEDLDELPPRVIIAEDVQGAIEEALLAALGMTREQAHAKLREVAEGAADDPPPEAAAS